MSQLGTGVMINLLRGNRESAETFIRAIGKRIASLLLKDNVLRFEFDDGSKMSMRDDGQSCCESRYMTTDDDLMYYVGSALIGGEIKDGPSKEGEYGEMHEIQFLVITTSKGAFTMETHNEHNGYYGGFSVVVESE